jgi:hypothetical protein
MKRGEPLEYLPEMFCTFEVSVRKDNYVGNKEFLYDKSFKGLERVFELRRIVQILKKILSSNISKKGLSLLSLK